MTNLMESSSRKNKIFPTTGRPPDRDWMDDGKEQLRKLVAILTPVVPAPARAPEPSTMDKLVQLLIRKLTENKPVPPPPPAPAEPTKLETILKTYFRGTQSPSQQSRPRPVRRNWVDVKCFSCGTTGHSAI